MEVSSTEDWSAYHAIRRAELFENRRRQDYDPNHPSERGKNKFSFIFKVNGEAAGTVRLDILDSGRAAVRLVAITKTRQRKGLGSQLMAALEAVARRKGVTTLVLNSAPEAVGFYVRLGYVRESWDDPEFASAEKERVQMTKSI